MAKKLEEILTEAEGYTKAAHYGKSQGAREAAMVKILGLAEAHAYIDVPGLGGPRLRAKRAHLREVERSLEVAESKTAAGHPALGQRKRELRSERDMLVRSIRAEEDRILAALSAAEA